MGRPTKPIVLTEEERSKLQEWARRPKTAQRLALRARIVLGCAEGLESRQVARQLRITDQTVCKWRSRFGASRLEGLVDEPRPGTPRKITDTQVEAVHHPYFGSRSRASDTLVHAQHGAGNRLISVSSLSHLAGVLVAATSGGNVQTVVRSLLH